MYIDSYYLFLILPALILAMIAQARVSGKFNKYSRVPSRNGLTGAQTARKLLDDNGLGDVAVERSRGRLSDHYDPRKRTVFLSEAVYDSPSVAAVGVAAHETGHAVQHGLGYVPLSVRSSILPVVSIGSNVAMPLFLLGLFIDYFIGVTNGSIGMIIMEAAIAMFTLVVVFQLVTLPVEFNASKRALVLLEERDILYPDEIAPVKEVLSAAALTYVAAAAMSVLQLLRLVAIAGGRRR